MPQSTILAVGMLPPPMGGQAMMFKRAIDALEKRYDLRVIDIQFQRNIGESGLFSARKLVHFFVLLFGQIAPLFLTRKFDILYYCLSGPSTLGLVKDLVFLGLLRLRARATVYHFHGAGGVTHIMRGNVFFRSWARLVLFEPELVLRPGSPSNEAALCNAKRDVIVNNCVEDPIAMIAKSVRKWPDGELLFAFVGAITEDKGVFDLVEIARLLRDRGYRFTVFLVGEGTPKETGRLKELIGRYDLAEFVQFTGVLIGERKFELLQRTTLFLFPTYFRAETQPTVLMEALAVGVPVVASDWRGINTIIDQGVNGYLVPPRDVETFCRAIEAILTEGKIDRMRTAARRIYLERFTLERHVSALMNAFESLDIQR